MRKIWENSAWDDYVYWQTQDRKTLKKINVLINDIQRNGYEGIGHPEPLKDNLCGWWSRRIDDANRIIYRVEDHDDTVVILQCKGHYSDRK
jgi:toxin YoeB